MKCIDLGIVVFFYFSWSIVVGKFIFLKENFGSGIEIKMVKLWSKCGGDVCKFYVLVVLLISFDMCSVGIVDNFCY